MSWRSRDSILFFGIAVSSFFAVRYLSYALHRAVELSEVNDYDDEPSKKDRAEDAIALESLKTLAESSTYEISKSAIVIACDRFYLNPTTRARLCDDLKSSDPEIAKRAGKASWLLSQYISGSARSQLPLHRGFPQGFPDGFLGMPPGPNDLPDESPEETRMRHREAMVLNDGERPLSQGDIIQRDRNDGRSDAENMTEAAMDAIRRGDWYNRDNASPDIQRELERLDGLLTAPLRRAPSLTQSLEAWRQEERDRVQADLRVVLERRLYEGGFQDEDMRRRDDATLESLSARLRRLEDSSEDVWITELRRPTRSSAPSPE